MNSDEQLMHRGSPGVSVGPNPFADELHFYLADGWDLFEVRLTITDMLGRELADEFLPVVDGAFSWQTDHLGSGQQMLIYRIQQKDRVYTGRVIKNPH
jgi:hypothetical protein